MELAGATIAVTGGTGFLGRNVARELEAADAKAFALGSRDYDLRALSGIRHDFHHVLAYRQDSRWRCGRLSSGGAARSFHGRNRHCGVSAGLTRLGNGPEG